MADYITIETVTCPICNSNIFLEQYIKDQMYVCAKLVNQIDWFGKKLDVCCCHIQAYCKGCGKVLDQDDYGKHGDVYECKECGKVNWPYTEYMQRKERLKAALKK